MELVYPLYLVLTALVQVSSGVSTCANVSPLMTHASGSPISDKTSTMTAGPRGPVVLQDITLLEELAHFNRERIPERVALTKGAGAFGYFEVTKTFFTQFCKAALFRAVGTKTKIFTRLSVGFTGSGSCDTVRGVRGTAIKFYTEDGNWDLVGINVPIFGIRDPILLPSFIHALARNPATHLPDAEAFWDFTTLRPEMAYMILTVFSDLGIPSGYRHMDMFGSHTFKVVNKDGKPFYCKFHLKTNQGVRNLTAEEATRLCGSDPDYAIRDLYNNIAARNFPSWTMFYQIMTFEQASKFKWNPFDVTKIWPENSFPLFEIGKLVLNTNPRNYFAQVEQSTFTPSNLVPGIEPSPDKMLQARLFAYPDAHRYRIGINSQQLDVNRPIVPVHNTLRDGKMRFGDNQEDRPNYFPNSDPRSVKVCPAASESKWPTTGDVDRYNTGDEDNFSQATMFWDSLDKGQQQRIEHNLVSSLKGVSNKLQKRALDMLQNISMKLKTEVESSLKNTTTSG